jgi:steroid delta-isomerase-like uncharacterized protein
MSLEENKAIVRRLFEAYNKQNLDVLDELFAPDYVDHILQLRSLESFKQFYTQFYKGFPDTHSTIEDIIAEGDKVWTRSTVTGTHEGEYRGLAPTGKKIAFAVVDIWRIVNGKIIESWGVYDMLDFYRQLGTIEYKEFLDEVS